MAVMTSSDFNTAMGITGTPTNDANGIPAFFNNQVVYDVNEYTQAVGANQPFTYNPYKVVGWQPRSLDFAGAEKFVESDGATAADPAANGQTGNVWFTRIQNVATGKIFVVHESDLRTLAQIKTLVGTEVNDWTDPA